MFQEFPKEAEAAMSAGKALFYHGTCADNLPDILKNGIVPGVSRNWNDSDDGHVYMWCPDRYAKMDGNEDAEPIQKHDRAFVLAAENSEFALARAKDCRRVVLIVALDPSAVSDDTSSDNMQGAVEHPGTIPPEAIVGAYIDKEPLDLFRGYFVGNVIHRDNATQQDWTEVEKSIGTIFAHSNIGCTLYEKLDDMISGMVPVKLPEPPIESLARGGRVKAKAARHSLAKA